MIVSVNISTVSALADAVYIYYTLEDDNPKEVIYHNTYDAENSNPITYYEGEADILLNDIERDGYRFLGWYTSPTFEEDTRVTMISADEPDVLELYARWEKIEEESVTDSSDDNIFTNPETNSSIYLAFGLIIILVLSTITFYIYRKYQKID